MERWRDGEMEKRPGRRCPHRGAGADDRHARAGSVLAVRTAQDRGQEGGQEGKSRHRLDLRGRRSRPYTSVTSHSSHGRSTAEFGLLPRGAAVTTAQGGGNRVQNLPIGARVIGAPLGAAWPTRLVRCWRPARCVCVCAPGGAPCPPSGLRPPLHAHAPEP